MAESDFFDTYRTKKLNIFKHIAMKKQIVVAKLTRF